MSHRKIVSTANNDFTVSLYQTLYPSVSRENMIFSPFSLHTVLGMVGEGARGETRTELLEGLRFKDETDGKVISNGYKLVLTGFEKNVKADAFTLLTANRVYSQTGFHLNPKFVASLRKNFKSDFVQLDFSTKGKCKHAAEKINEWVMTTTKNKIKNLVSPDDLGPMTSLVLVNGIYFKGLWKEKFNPRDTTKKPFNVTPTKQVQVDMMESEFHKFPYGKFPQLKAEAVALPYKGGRLSMVIILPMDVDGLGTVQENIGSILSNGKRLVLNSLSKHQKVAVSLPRFKVEATLANLKEVLGNIGIKSMFSQSKADLSGGILDDGEDHDDLYVSKVVQKAFIEVNEEGSEAAAATFADELKCSSGPQPVNVLFEVDRPFYFQIVDHRNGDMVLFSGHVNDPSV